jgi:4-amino-4-deoxy-L-arabinose transferase-like glycosyltransferase
MESQPDSLKQSWLSRHPRVVIGMVLLLCLGPFLDKAVHVDDPLFIWTAQWIRQHPADFFGAEVNWFGCATPMWAVNCNPPLMPYFLAAVASVFGWHEIVLHLAGLVVAFVAAAGIYALAQIWCGRPLLAAVIAVFTPVFLVSSSTLMCDVLMLAFWIWALVLWERALAGGQSRWQFIGAGFLAGLAVLTKYSAVTLLPLLPLLSLLRTRSLKWRWGWLALAISLTMLAVYEWVTYRMSGESQFLAATHYVQMSRHASGDWPARGIITLAFAGGSLLPLLFFAPRLWRPRHWLGGGAVILAVLLGVLCPGGNLWLVQHWTNPEPMNQWGFVLQVALLTAAGVHLLLLAAAEFWQRRDTIAAALGLWILSGLLFAWLLNWTVSARNFLPLVPAAAILLVRRWDALRQDSPVRLWTLWPLAPSAIVALALMVADYRVAACARSAAKQIVAQYTPAGHKLWFEGHWGFQYYLEKLGGRPLDIAGSVLEPGDVIAVPFANSNMMPLPPGSVGWVADLEFAVDSGINLSIGAPSEAGGFYSSIMGPVPFAVGKTAPQSYCVLKVLTRVQFNTQCTDPAEKQRGAVVANAPISFTMEPEPVPQVKPGVAEEIQQAVQSQLNGNLRETIDHYRRALAIDPDNPAVLNNLAWLLTTAATPDLRDGQAAVQLATRAVELTGYSKPVFIGTLAAAHAQAGQFPEAFKMAVAAAHLAQVTGQIEVTIQNARLAWLYANGRAVDAAGDLGPP